MQPTLLDLFEIRTAASAQDDVTSLDIEVDVEEPPPSLPPTRGPRVWLSED